MLFLAAILPALALAAPAKHADKSFSVVQFTDSGTPHSVTAIISFNVSAPAHGKYPALASTRCTATESTSPSIATATYPTNCTDSSVQFWLEGARSGYYLTLARDLGAGIVEYGTKYLGKDVETRAGVTPTGDVQYLNTSSTFEVPYTRSA